MMHTAAPKTPCNYSLNSHVLFTSKQCQSAICVQGEPAGRWLQNESPLRVAQTPCANSSLIVYVVQLIFKLLLFITSELLLADHPTLSPFESPLLPVWDQRAKGLLHNLTCSASWVCFYCKHYPLTWNNPPNNTAAPDRSLFNEAKEVPQMKCWLCLSAASLVFFSWKH